MVSIRIIPRLDIKGPNVIKGIHLEGLRKVGKPHDLSIKYYEGGADEILYMDVVASLYNRSNLSEIVSEASKNVFIPLTVGGGVRTIDDFRKILRSGADKISINTGAIKNPELITQAANMFGSQCVVVSIEAIKTGDMKWEAFVDNGRDNTGLDVIEWAKQAEQLGAGELIITSVDFEGTKKGFDIELIKRITDVTSIPVIACGGAGSIEHIIECIEKTGCSAVAIASILHYNITSLQEIKQELKNKNIKVRNI